MKNVKNMDLNHSNMMNDSEHILKKGTDDDYLKQSDSPNK